MSVKEFAALRDFIENKIPFNHYLGVKVRSLEQGKCTLAIPYRPELLGDSRRKAIHGGVLSMLIDTCGGFAVWSMCDLDDRIATIDLRVDYLKPAVETDLMAEATVKLLGQHPGRNLFVLKKTRQSR